MATTSERLAVMESNIEYIKDSLSENNKQHKDILNKLEDLDKKFAGKWVEKVAIGALITIIGGAGLLLMSLS